MMDAIEILTNLNQLEAYFQPIFSAEEHVVVAYELSGKFFSGDKIVNLNTFAYDEEVPEEYRVEIEYKILNLALSKLKDLPSDIAIYIPFNANLLILDYGDGLFDLIKEYIPEEELHRIVLVISEHNFTGEFDQLNNILRYLRTYGIKIAINQVGPESHFDYITMLSPHILKLNIEQLSYDSWTSQNDLIGSVGMLARKIGANILFEGINIEYQLQFAWKNGGRYYQGKYLGEAKTETIEKDLLKNHFKDECQQFITIEKKQLEEFYKEKKVLKESIEGIVDRLKPASNNKEQLLALAKELDEYSFRIYICDEDGFQLTPNIFKVEGQWLVQEQAIGKNWSWRPYFLKTIIQMRNDQNGMMSDVYSDIETGEFTRTFSIPLNESEYLFIDISYDYLYEHNILR